MLQIVPIVSIEPVEDLAYDREPTLRRLRPQESRKAADGVRRVFGGAVNRAFQEGRTRNPGLDNGSVDEAMPDAGQETIGRRAVESREVGVSAQEGPHQVDDQGRDSARGARSEEAGETGLSSFPPAPERSIDDDRDTGRHEVVGRWQTGAGQDVRIFRPLGHASGATLRQAADGLSHGGAAEACSFECVAEMKPNALARGHRR